ncbi:MAG: hypothetical protein ACSHX6_15300 [Akkermansiaceae bacterium]
MKKQIILAVLSVSVALLANSCAPSTPAVRIAKNPAMFEKLSTSDKALAQQGQIKRGMHKDGVLIAWGKPSGLSAGSRNGKSFEKWVYSSSSPVYTSSFRQYANYGYGRRGWYGPGYGIGFGPEVYYVQRTAATVEFDSQNKVSDWMTNQ